MHSYIIKITLFITLIILVIFYKKREQPNKENPLYIKSKKEKKGSILFLLVVFLLYLIYMILFKEKNIETLIVIIILLTPLTTLYSSKEKKAYCLINKIYYKEISEEEKTKFKKAHIKLIKTNKEEITYEKNLFFKITKSRKEYDNYWKAKKYLISVYLPLILSYFLFLILSTPFSLSIEFALLLKIITTIMAYGALKQLPEEKDIMKRMPYKSKQSKQEIFFLFMQIFLVLFSITIPYMYFLANIENTSIALTIFYITFLFSNIWTLLYEYNDGAILWNLIKIGKEKKIRYYFLLIFLLPISLTLLRKPNIGLQNHFACGLISLLSISPLELIKIARFTKRKE